MTNAWIALLPLYGPVVAVLKSGEHAPLLRGAGAGADINSLQSREPFGLRTSFPDEGAA